MSKLQFLAYLTQVGLVLLLWGCAGLHDVVLRPTQSEPRYDELYPYYVELCAVSQIRAIFAEHGGSPGHAVMYLKGACPNWNFGYPLLELCDPEEYDLSDPESGTGISVNKTMKNVNWLAVPGKKLFYYGNLQEGQILDKEYGLSTLQYAAESGIFEGIEIHDQYKTPEGDRRAQVHFLASETLGTDFALNFGRSIWCSRVPLPKQGLLDMIEYLNAINREYATGEADYNWSGYSDNCSHLLRNSLAAAGVWKPKSVNTVKLLQFFNMSVPANEFVNLATLSTTFPIENFDKIYRDEVLRQSLIERNWLPIRHGAVLQLIPTHQDNELYDTRVRILLLEGPLFKRKSSKISDMFSDWRFTGTAANLRYFRKKYESILEDRPEDWDVVEPGNEYQRTRKFYYEYIEEQLQDVRSKLTSLYPNQKEWLQGRDNGYGNRE